jgi:long-chain acyl-CoA synthetase
MIHDVKVRKCAPYRIERTRTLQELVDSLGNYAEKTAILTLTKHDRARWSFAQLAQHAREFASGLIRAGVQRGESVVLFAENRPEWIAAALGVIRRGRGPTRHPVW